MKKLLLYFLFIIFLSTCTKGDKLRNYNEFKNYEVIEIDGCEYIQYGGTNGFLKITHKGNCKNEFHICK